MFKLWHRGFMFLLSTLPSHGSNILIIFAISYDWVYKCLFNVKGKKMV